jgi:two-component sensor histidine kinase
MPFPISKKAQLSIRLNQEANQYALTITDNGRGFLPTPVGEKGLGFSIMENLATQLGGDIHFSGDKGMRTRIVFPSAA